MLYILVIFFLIFLSNISENRTMHINMTSYAVNFDNTLFLWLIPGSRTGIVSSK